MQRKAPYDDGTIIEIPPKKTARASLPQTITREDQELLDELTSTSGGYRQEEEEDDGYEYLPQRALKSRATQAKNTTTSRTKPPRHHRSRRDYYEEDDRQRSGGKQLLLWVCAFLVIVSLILAALWGAAFLVMSGVQSQVNNWTQGTTRTVHLDTVLGHNHDMSNNPSHLVAMILRGEAKLMEIPGGDDSKAKMFVGPQLAQLPGWQGDPSQAILSITVKDMNGDQRPDVLIGIEGPLTLTFGHSQYTWVLYNTGDSLTMQQPSNKGRK